jgi:hypothetical protein
LAERAGLISSPETKVDLIENLYQTTGAIGGLVSPWKALGFYFAVKEDLKKENF